MACALLMELPDDLLMRVALRLPSAADAQRFMRQTSRALRQRLAGHVGAFPVAWMLHHHPSTALTHAARRGDAALLAALLVAPGDLPDRDNALTVAAGAGHVAAVHVLLTAGVDPNVGLLPAASAAPWPAEDGRTRAAVAAGRTDTVRALVRAGADPFRDGSGAAVRAAIKTLDNDVLRELLGFERRWVLLRTDISIRDMDYDDGWSPMPLLLHPLVTAARAGDWPAVQAQLHLPNDLYAWDGRKVSRRTVKQAAVDAAAAAGHGTMVLRLVQAAQAQEADQSPAWLDGALAAAACRGRCNVVQRLIQAGITASTVTRALEEASQCGQLGAVSQLLAAGAKVGPPTLVNAAAAGDVDVLQVLIKAGRPGGVSLCPALEAAACGGRAEAAQVLVRGWPGGCPAHALDNALDKAVTYDNAEAVQALITAGARVETLSEGTMSAAVRRGDVATLRVLEAAGADVARGAVAVGGARRA